MKPSVVGLGCLLIVSAGVGVLVISIGERQPSIAIQRGLADTGQSIPASSPSPANTTSTTGRSVIRLEAVSKPIELGQIADAFLGESVHFEIPVVNVHQSTLVVGLESGCSCLRAYCEPNSIMPGAQGHLIGTINTKEIPVKQDETKYFTLTVAASLEDGKKFSMVLVASIILHPSIVVQELTPFGRCKPVEPGQAITRTVLFESKMSQPAMVTIRPILSGLFKVESPPEFLFPPRARIDIPVHLTQLWNGLESIEDKLIYDVDASGHSWSGSVTLVAHPLFGYHTEPGSVLIIQRKSESRTTVAHVRIVDDDGQSTGNYEILDYDKQNMSVTIEQEILVVTVDTAKWRGFSRRDIRIRCYDNGTESILTVPVLLVR